MKKNIEKNQKGFYMMEVIIAIFLVSVGILAAIALLVSTMKIGQNDRDQVISTSLAEEGIELARNIRDNNWVAGGGTFGNKFPAANNNDNCLIDPIGSLDMSSSCGSTFAQEALYPNTNNYYVHSGTGAARFHRKIMVKYDGASTNATANSATITSIVVWGKTSFPAVSSCSASNQCAYSQIVLTKWGE